MDSLIRRFMWRMGGLSMAGGELQDWRQTPEDMLEHGQVSCDDARTSSDERDLTVKHQRLLVEHNPDGLSHDEKPLGQGQDCEPEGSGVGHDRHLGDDVNPFEAALRLTRLLGADAESPSANDNQVRSRERFTSFASDEMMVLGGGRFFASGIADRLCVSEISLAGLLDDHFEVDLDDYTLHCRQLAEMYHVDVAGRVCFGGTAGTRLGVFRTAGLVYFDEFLAYQKLVQSVASDPEPAKRARLATKPMGHCALNVSLSKSSSVAAMHRTPSPQTTSCAFCTTVRCGRGP
eukprot:TRINITY_DN30551_c0_g1_i2.p1 TRINITY_DN30551_c0_g1~~TRINITY_DN30551_c0_g1_i2.p1  ORF type:complete len:290 (+),score=21.89 TRINITY_DN30551_c0_g1_i2:269-1138(+)